MLGLGFGLEYVPASACLISSSWLKRSPNSCLGLGAGFAFLLMPP